MLCRDFVPRSDNAALEQRERRLDGICVNVGSGSDILFAGVVDRSHAETRQRLSDMLADRQ